MTVDPVVMSFKLLLRDLKAEKARCGSKESTGASGRMGDMKTER